MNDEVKELALTHAEAMIRFCEANAADMADSTRETQRARAAAYAHMTDIAHELYLACERASKEQA